MSREILDPLTENKILFFVFGVTGILWSVLFVNNIFISKSANHFYGQLLAPFHC